MKKTCLVLVLVSACLWAVEPRLGGFLAEDDTVSFNVRVPENGERWLFTMKGRTDDASLWLKLSAPDGTELDDIRIGEGQLILLPGPQDLVILPYALLGSGKLKAHRNPEFVLPDGAVFHDQVSGYLNKGEEQVFAVTASSDEEQWSFEPDSGLVLEVEVFGLEGAPVGTYNPAKEPTVTLEGGGEFSFHVKATKGKGRWLAKLGAVESEDE